MTSYFIIPGLGNSGPDHWQTYFEKNGSNFRRIQQENWDSPECDDWISTIDKALATDDLSSSVLIGHSLGCLAIVHWANTYQKQVKGAMLVAPSDAEADVYTFPAKGFSPIPLARLNFKTIVVTSTDDTWVSLERAEHFAKCWGSELLNLGAAGHINVASGYTNWDEGLHILQRI